MAIASSNRTALRYIKEVTFGTTPATPALDSVRFTGESLNYNLTKITSNEIRSDRMKSSLVTTQAEVAGDVNFEMSHGGHFDDWLEWLMCSEWGTPAAGEYTMKNGVMTHSMTIQKHLQDSTTDTFFNFTGCRVGSMDLNVQVGQIVSGKFGVMGLGAATSTTQIAGATFPAGSTTDVLNAVNNVLSIKEDTVTSTNKFSRLSISVNNNLRAQRAIGSLPSIGIALGAFDVTGNMELYFENLTMYNRFLNSTELELEFTLQDAANNYYLFNVPNLRIQTSQVVAGGLDQDIMLSATFVGIRDATAAASLVVKRKP